MKKIFLFLIISLVLASLVLASQGEFEDKDKSEKENEIKTSSEYKNQGGEDSLRNRIEVRSGNYENSEGKQIEIRNEEEFKLKVGDIEAKSEMEIESEYDSNQKIKLTTQLSNGKKAEVKIMPDTASEKALERLRLKVCNSENGCSIELKEVGKTESEKQLAYELKAQKEARLLGIFKTEMQVEAQINAETGEIIQTGKPWWAFLASESE